MTKGDFDRTWHRLEKGREIFSSAYISCEILYIEIIETLNWSATPDQYYSFIRIPSVE